MSAVGSHRIIGKIGPQNDYKHFDEYLERLPLARGRAETNIKSNIPHLCIGKDELTISRKHAKIFWDDKEKVYKVLHYMLLKVMYVVLNILLLLSDSMLE